MLVKEEIAAHCKAFDEKIAGAIEEFGEPTKLRDACHYALTTGGKRFRPLIVLLIAEALGKGKDVSFSALSVEFFHTASLIADDLPCMDNDDNRRNKPSLHRVYGESVALLASYALITAAFQKIHDNAEDPEAGMLALETASRCAGILGATGGQFFDLYPPTPSLQAVERVIYLKTVTLFEVCFVFGWVFGGGDLLKLDLVKKAAYHFGMAFQTADDLEDLLQDAEREKVTSLGHWLGTEGALAYFEAQVALLNAALEDLGLMTPHFQYLIGLMEERAQASLSKK